VNEGHISPSTSSLGSTNSSYKFGDAKETAIAFVSPLVGDFIELVKTTSSP